MSSLSTQASSDVLMAVPDDLPVPLDDGACSHLDRKSLPALDLLSTAGATIRLSSLRGWNVIFCYPMTGRPGIAIPDHWIDIPGAAGCTPQVCSYRENFAALQHLGVGVYGLSTQETEVQQEAVERLQLPYQLLSDAKLALAHALSLPTFEVNGMTLIKRLTMITHHAVIQHCFYPVFPPHQNVHAVLDWFRHHESSLRTN